MPTDFRATKTELVLDFLEKAAADEKFRKKLEKASRPALRDLLAGYGIKISYRDIKKAPRTVPSPEQCQQLITIFRLDQVEYAKSQYDYNPSLVGPLMLVVAFAMPLLATEDGEAAPAS